MFQFRFPHKEKGQGLVEYALILVLVSITVIVVLSFLGDSVGRVFQTVDAALNRQALTGTGTEFVVGGFSVTPGTGTATCTNIIVPSVTVTRYENGVPTAGAVSISALATGGTAVTVGGTANASGVATFGPITLSGNCSGSVTITAGANSRSASYSN
jgi:pilus assembly protein Flp/PilA